MLLRSVSIPSHKLLKTGFFSEETSLRKKYFHKVAFGNLSIKRRVYQLITLREAHLLTCPHHLSKDFIFNFFSWFFSLAKKKTRDPRLTRQSSKAHNNRGNKRYSEETKMMQNAGKTFLKFFWKLKTWLLEWKSPKEDQEENTKDISQKIKQRDKEMENQK